MFLIYSLLVKLTKALQCSITFDPTSCIFQDLETKKEIGSGQDKDGLYYLDHDGSFSLAFSALSAIVSPLQWHFHLAYPIFGKI